MQVCRKHVAKHPGTGLSGLRAASRERSECPVLPDGQQGALFPAAEETFPVNREGTPRRCCAPLLTWTGATPHLLRPGVRAPGCFPALQLGDQSRFGDRKGDFSKKKKDRQVEADTQSCSCWPALSVTG